MLARRMADGAYLAFRFISADGTTTEVCPKTFGGHAATLTSRVTRVTDLERRGMLDDTLVVWGVNSDAPCTAMPL